MALCQKKLRRVSDFKSDEVLGVRVIRNLVFCTFALFTLDNTASVLTRRNGFRRQEQSVYYLPIFIVDSGSPSLSSTNTLTIRVCDCDADGVAQTCNAEAYVLPAGLSTGALVAILACVLTLLGRCPLRAVTAAGGQDFSYILRTRAGSLTHAVWLTEEWPSATLSSDTVKSEIVNFYFVNISEDKWLLLKMLFLKILKSIYHILQPISFRVQEALWDKRESFLCYLDNMLILEIMAFSGI